MKKEQIIKLRSFGIKADVDVWSGLPHDLHLKLL